jgi:outer membrane protein
MKGIAMRRHASFLFFSLALAAVAGQAAELKIGFVNQERILREAPAAKRVQEKLEKEFASRRADLDRLQKQGRDLEATLQKESVTLPEADRVAKERQLSQLTRDFQRMQREFREDLSLRQNEEYASLQERANKVINSIAERKVRPHFPGGRVRQRQDRYH